MNFFSCSALICTRTPLHPYAPEFILLHTTFTSCLPLSFLLELLLSFPPSLPPILLCDSLSYLLYPFIPCPLLYSPFLSTLLTSPPTLSPSPLLLNYRAKAIRRESFGQQEQSNLKFQSQERYAHTHTYTHTHTHAHTHNTPPSTHTHTQAHIFPIT
jgi:hypothetical protein